MLTPEAYDRRRSSADSIGIGKVTAQLRRRLSSDLRTFRVAILGMAGVGKSALAVRFLTRRFIGEYDHNLETKSSCTLPVDDELVLFEVMDLAVKNLGDRDTISIDGEHLRWADAFFLVYDVTRRKTLDACQDFRAMVLDTRGNHSHTGIMLLGNKADLWQARQVSRQEGEDMAATLGCSFCEVTAAEDYQSVQHAFMGLYREVRGHGKANPKTLLDRLFRTWKKS